MLGDSLSIVPDWIKIAVDKSFVIGLRKRDIELNDGIINGIIVDDII